MCAFKVILFALAASLACGISWAEHIDPCKSSWQLHASVIPCPVFTCPQGDTDSFIDQGWWISICVLGSSGQPDPDIPPNDFWLQSFDPLNNLALCGGAASSNADSLTNAAGKTTMSNSSLAAGGCFDGLSLVVQGFVLLDSLTNCASIKIAPIHVRNPDLDGSSGVDLIDLSVFALYYPPNLYVSCGDFNLDGTINLQDLSRFAPHFGPPGHSCL